MSGSHWLYSEKISSSRDNSYYSIYQGFKYPIFVTASQKGLTGLKFLDSLTNISRHLPVESQQEDAVFASLFKELDTFFRAEPPAFNVPLDIKSGTPFQRAVWQQLLQIPFGQVCTYGEMAKSIGRPGAQRAVGQANAANPIPVVIPCHRVIAAHHRVGGYSAGVEIKKLLLAMEGHDRNCHLNC